MHHLQNRQGDVLLNPLSSKPENLKPAASKVLALGEATGHKHVVIDGDVYVGSDGQLVVHAKENTQLGHLTRDGGKADHLTYDVSPGWYSVTIERDCDPWTGQEVGRVID